MVKLKLSIAAELENVTNLEPVGNNFEFRFKVKCSSCNEEHPKTVSLNRAEEYEVSGSKNAKANFVWRCGLCRRESSAKFESTPITPYKAENAQFGPLLVIECRGLEFIGFDPEGTWKCVGTESGTVFSEVELAEGEWSDYDEKASLPVNISKIDSKWERA
ncbi:hypothetical protein CPB83DRAFT_841630 [Crepidotus variabilis]|uniref:DUF866-domain-containing protein n=1 Tax=Crepidotus variabilis TaxID=179855 RepID=A0A9P6EUM8_9AGAR|nr:hypothetical protein CPB83DRAFT_841630 [Crepidotus variabilis]